MKADKLTGEWTGNPELESDVQRADWDALKDTDAVHFDTFENNGETCAIKVLFVD